MIGQGGFAKVFRCELDGQSAVAKAIDSSKLNEEMTYLLTNECTIWASLAHPHIVSFYGMAATPTAVLLVCELLPNGALQDKLERLRKGNAPVRRSTTCAAHAAPHARRRRVPARRPPPHRHRRRPSAP